MDENHKSYIIEKYKKLHQLYSENTLKIEKLVKELMDEKKFKVHSITSRTKDLKSLEKKVNTKGNIYETLEDITDLSGIRVICFFSSDVDKAAEIISGEFKIDSKNSIDKRKIYDPDRFGYLSLHYIVQLSDDRSNLLEYSRFKELKCEIQIRSILQHAWAEIEHDLGYKSIYGVPQNIQRKFYRQAGLLELADEEFVTIKQEIEMYSIHVKDQLSHSYENILIDKISLENYIVTSEVANRIDRKIAYAMKSPFTEMIMDSERLIKTINFFDIGSISKLDELLKQYEDMIFKFVWDWFRSRSPSVQDKKKLLKIEEYVPVIKEENIPMNKGFITRGICIFYLGYILVAKSRDMENIKKYTSQEGEPIENEDLAEKIMFSYKKISKS